MVLQAHLNRSKRILNNFKKAYNQLKNVGNFLENQVVGGIKPSSISQIGMIYSITLLKLDYV